MFQILGVFSEIEVSIVSGVYSVVARVYDIMLDLIQDTSDLTGTSFVGFVKICYVLAGVFMLFRVVVAMIQMLINPDKVNDGKQGAGKMIVRIIVSIVLLLVLVPDGILFAPYNESDGSGGLLPRIEHALISADDGLINKLVDGRIKLDSGSSKMNSETLHVNRNEISYSNSFFVENVYADDKDPLTCYYYNVEEIRDYTFPGNGSEIKIGDFYKIYFTTTKKSGWKQLRVLVADENVQGNVYYYVSNARVRGGVYGNDFRYKSLPDNRTLYDYDKMFYDAPVVAIGGNKRKAVLPEECPKYLDISGDSKADIAVKEKTSNIDTGILGGYDSIGKMIAAINKKYGNDCVDANGNPVVNEGECKKGIKTKFLSNVDNTAIAFAQGTASSFQECAEGADCSEAQSEMFTSIEGNNKLAQLIDGGELELGFIMSMLAGIGLIVYLLILCVDVIIRRFKLMLLQVMAPIPAISYVDPNDKVFNQWLKMYISTYLDLFIKLIAIAIAVSLMKGVFDGTTWENGNLLYRFFYIVAILVFAKLIPSMISKIFGLDSMGGSFKDIMGMAKGAAGFGAGAVLGAAAGAATGQGLGRLSGFAKGALMGAGSGSKGKVFGGAQGIAAKNAKINQQKADGLSLGERMLVGMAGATGIVPGAKAETQMDRSASAIDAQSNYKKYLLDQVKKKNMNIDASANKVGGSNPAGILRKGAKADANGNYAMSDYVASANEKDIDMKNEYAKQANLATLTADQWNNMTEDQIRVAFGTKADGSGFTSLAEAQVYQNDRVAALEDFAAGAMANHLKDDRENIKEYNAMVDAVSKAQGAGVAINDVPKLGEFNNKTLSKVKDQAIDGYNKAADDSSLKIKKHIQN